MSDGWQWSKIKRIGECGCDRDFGQFIGRSLVPQLTIINKMVQGYENATGGEKVHVACCSIVRNKDMDGKQVVAVL